MRAKALLVLLALVFGGCLWKKPKGPRGTSIDPDDRPSQRDYPDRRL